MRTDLLNIIVYIFRKYPRINELSKPRLVKLIYLADWKSSIDYGNQISGINWYFNHYGPYVEDVIQLIKKSKSVFNVNSYINEYGGSSDKITLIEDENHIREIGEKEKAIIDLIIEKTYTYNWNDFISIVYSTYPVRNNPKYSNLNLIECASQYNKLRKNKKN